MEYVKAWVSSMQFLPLLESWGCGKKRLQILDIKSAEISHVHTLQGVSIVPLMCFFTRMLHQSWLLGFFTAADQHYIVNYSSRRKTLHMFFILSMC